MMLTIEPIKGIINIGDRFTVKARAPSWLQRVRHWVSGTQPPEKVEVEVIAVAVGQEECGWYVTKH